MMHNAQGGENFGKLGAYLELYYNIFIRNIARDNGPAVYMEGAAIGMCENS